MQQQQTIKEPISFTGIGIHSGKPCTMTLYPSKSDTGIIFKRIDTQTIIPVHPKNLAHTQRATALQIDQCFVKTPEHILAALAGLNIHNVIIEISDEEIPIMDGSSLNFVEKIRGDLIQVQENEMNPITLQSPLILTEKDAVIMALPANKTTFTYHLHFSTPWIGSQTVHFDPSNNDFKTEIAPARTFGFTHEIEFLKKNGLALGGSLENALVLGESDYVNPTRFTDELARHKLLDLMGDCWVLGRPILANIIGIKSGHSLTMKLVQTISEKLKA